MENQVAGHWATILSTPPLRLELLFPGPPGQFQGSQRSFPLQLPGVPNLLVSLHHTGRRGVLGHIINTWQHIITKKKPHHVFSKFTILCRGVFTAILGCMWPGGHRLNAPGTLCQTFPSDRERERRRERENKNSSELLCRKVTCGNQASGRADMG